MNETLLTIQEAATFLRVSPTTLRRWEEKGILKPQRTAGNQRRYALDQLKIFKSNGFTFPEPIAPINQTPVIARNEAKLNDAAIPTMTQIEQGIAASQAPRNDEEIKPNVQVSTASASNFNASAGFPLPVKKTKNNFVPLLSGMIALFVLAGGFIVAAAASPNMSAGLQKFAAGMPFGQSKTGQSANSQVLAANDTQPVFVLKVNVPSIFGQEASFLDTVGIKKELTVEGVSILSGGIDTKNADIDAGTGSLTASNVLYSVLAGSNITITGDPQNPTISADLGGLQSVTSFQGQSGAVALAQGSGIGLDGLTITNTGVLSVQGQSGSVAFSQGAGITLNGLTITNADPGTAQKIFGTFRVGTTDITAGSNTDTFTFAAGSGVTLTPDAAGKKLTIDASGATSQWQTAGSDIYYNNGNVGIGNTAPARSLDVTGTGRFTGALTLANLGTGIVKSDATGLLSSSALNLASAEVTGSLGIANGGTGVVATPTNGQLLIGNGSGFTLGTITAGSGIGVANGSGTISVTNNGVLSLTGTANQITTSGGTGAITLSLPQNIATTSTPTFASMTLTANTNQLTLGTGNTGVLSLGTLTGGRTYTLPDASGEICLDTGNCPTGGGGTIGGSGTSGYVPRFTNATTIGNSLIYDTGTKVGVGTISPEGLFSVSGGVAGKALVSLNETGNQNILTGSASGTTRFYFDQSGNLSLNGGGLQFNGVNVLSGSTLGSGITSSSLTSVSTLNAGSIGSGFGAIDVGTDAISGGDITATGTTGITIAGNGAGVTFSGTGNHVITASSGVLQFGAATLNGAITGNNQNVTGLQNLSASGTITFGGLSTGIVKSNGSGVLSSSAVNLASSDVTGSLGVTNGGTGLNSFATGDLIYASGANTLAARTIGTAGQILTVSGGIPVWMDAGGTINFWQRANGALAPFNVTDDFLIGGSATSSAKFQVSGTTGNATTSGSLTFSTASAMQTTANQSLTIGGATTGNIILSPLNGSGLVSVNGSVTVSTGNAYQINGANVLTSTALGSSVTGSSLTSVGSLAGGSIVSGFGTITTANTITGTTLNGTTGINTGAAAGTQRIDASGNLVNIGAVTASGTVTLSSLGTGVVQSNASGVLSSAALNLAGGASYISGILPSSNGGTGANLSAATQGSVTYFSSTGVMSALAPSTAGYVLSTNGAGANPSWIDASTLGTNYFQRNLGALSPLNISDDLLVGGTATSSAKFQIFGNTGNATSSGNLTFNGASSIQTTNNQTFTIGGASTGNIVLSPLNGSGLVTINGSANLSSGNVYQINGANVLSATALGSGVTSSSLTSVGSLASGSIVNGFGSIFTANTIQGSDITASGANGFVASGSNADLTFNGGGTNIISSTGTLQINAFTLGGAVTGNNQNVTGLNNLSAGGTVTLSSLGTGVVQSNASGVLSSSALNLAGGASYISGILPSSNGGTGANLSAATQGSISYFSATGVMSALAPSTAGFVLTTGGAGANPTWTDAASLGTNYFQRNLGTVSPLNITDDLLVGGNATSSAKFQISGTTGNATTSGSLTFSTASSIQTTANQTLTIGGNTTGNITLSPLNGNGSVTSTGDLNLVTGKGYQINGANVLTATALGTGVTGSSLTSVGALATGSIANGFGSIFTANTIQGSDITASGATGFTASGNEADLTFSGTGTHLISASAGTLQLGAVTLNGAVTGNGQSVTGLQNLSAAGTITFGGFSTNNGLLYTNGSGVVAQAGAGTSGQLVIASATGVPTFVTLGTDATLSDTGALTIAANAVALGADTTGNYVATLTSGNGISASATGEGSTPTVALGALTADWDQTGAFDIVLNNAASEFRIKESAGNTFFGTLDAGDLSADRTYTLPDSTGTICLVEAGNCAGSGTGVTTPGGTTNRLVKFTGSQSVGNASIDDLYTTGVALTIDATGRLGLGTASPTGLLTVSGGDFGGNAAAVFNQTGAASNDIITASASGVTKFTVNNNGNLQFTGNTSFINTVTSLATANRTYTLPNESGTFCLTTGNCAGAGSGLTGSGTINQIAYFDAAGNVTSEASGFAWDPTNNRLGIGIDAPLGKFQVSGASTGNALAILDELGDQNILVGSASGTTRFVFDRTGNLNLNGGGYQISGANVLTATALGTGVTGSSLTSVGALATGSIASGFGTITTANTITGTTINGTTGINTGATGGTQRIDASGNLVNIANVTASGTITFSNLGTGVVQSNASGVLSSAALNLAGGASYISGILPSSNGGTGANLSGAAQGAIPYFSATGVMSALAPSTAGYVLTTGGAGANPTWTDASTLGTNYLQRNLGALSPLNITDDFLIGGTATGSAKFQIFANTGNATTSGTLTFNGANSIQTTNNQSLTIGGNTTGNITLSPLNGNGSVTSTGDLNLATGKGYQINGANVLTATALGTGVTGSSLTSVGALASGSIASGFGTITTANTITGTTLNGTTGINTGATGGTQRIDASGNLVNIGAITASGTLTFSNYSTDGGILYTNASGVVGQTATGLSGQVLISNAGGAPTWADAATIGTNYWQRNLGTLSPLNITDDLLVGGNATASAKFQVFGLTGNATTSGTLTFNTAGNVQTTNNQTLTFGGTSTGNIVFSPLNGAGTVTSTGTLTLASGKTYQINGTDVLSSNTLGSGVTGSSLTSVGALASGSIASGFGTITTANTITGTTINGTTGINTGATAGTQRIDASGNLLNIGTITASGAITFSNLGTGVVQSNASGVLSSAALNLAGGASYITGVLPAANGGTGDDTSGTTGVPYISAGNWSYEAQLSSARGGTGANLSGAAQGAIPYFSSTGVMSALAPSTAGYVLTTGGASANPTWTDAASLGTNYFQRNLGAVSPLNITDDLLVGGNATASAKFQIFGLTGNATTSGSLTFNTASSIQTTANQTLTIGGNTTGNITLSPLNGNGSVTSTGDLNLATGKGYQINGANVLTATALGTGVTGSSLTSVGALASGSIASGFGTITTANTITGTTLNGTTGINTGATAGTQRIDASGNLVNIGTIDSTYLDATSNNVNLAASTALQFNGTTVINSSRQLENIAGLSTSLTPTAANTYALGTAAGNQFSTIYGQTLYQNGNQVCDTGGNCSGLAVNYWDQLNGALSAKNTTVDLLIGGTSSDSAKFAVLNVNAGTPTASVSAGTNGAAYITATGTLQSTNNQSLTIGGNTTGNITLSPLNGSGTTLNTGNLNLSSSKAYQIAGVDVLTSAALGSGVTGSSLTQVGALASGSIASGFGTIATANTITGTTVNGTTGINTGAGAGTLRIDTNGNLSNIGTINASGAITLSNLGAGIVKSTAGGLLSSSALNLASGTEVTGTLGVGNGGTGFASYATGDLLVGNGSSTLSKLAIGTDGQILSVAGGTPSWISSASLNFFQRANGAIAPLNITDDFLLGGVATNSARFAFINNIGSGTPTASISANSGNNATYLTGAGNLATTNMQRLSFGGATTGGFNFQSGVDSTSAFNLKTATGNNQFTIDTINNRVGIGLGGNVLPTLYGDGVELKGALRFNGNDFDQFTSPQGSLLSTKINIPLYNPGAFGQILAFGLPNSAASSSRAISIFDNRSLGNNQPPLALFSPDENSIFGLSWDGDNDDAYLKTLGQQNIHIAANGANLANFMYTGRVGFGTSNPSASFELTRDLSTHAATGKSLAIFNQTENQDIFTASSAGSTRFTIKNDGTVNLATGVYNTCTALETINGVLTCGTDAGEAVTNYWQFNNGAVSPFVDTADLLIGGTSTASAKFAFINNTGSGTPTASISAGLTGSTYLTATGVIGTTNAQTLTLGSASTGNLAFAPGGVTAFTAFANGRIGIGTTNPLATLDLRGNSGTLPAASISGQTSNASLIVDNSGVGDLFTASKSGATKFVIRNDGTVGIGTANTTLPTTAALGIYSPSDTTTSLLIKQRPSQSSDLLNIVFNNDTSAFKVDQFGHITTSGDLKVGRGLGVGGADAASTYTSLAVAPLNTGIVGIQIAANNGQSANLLELGIGFGNTNAWFDESANLRIGLNTPDTGKLNVTGAYTGKALAILNETGNQDIFTASSAGTTRFRIANNGQVAINSLTNCNTIDTDANGVLSCGVDAGDAALNYWQFNNGAVSPFVDTADLLIGGTSTASAKFAFINNTGSGTPTASISATAGSTSLTAAGVLQTTNKQTLTLGGSTTGNILINPARSLTVQPGTDSVTAFQVLRNNLASVFTVDTTNILTRVSGAGSDADFTSGTGALQIGADNSFNIAFDDNEIIARNNGAASTLFVQNGGGNLQVGANDTIFQNAVDNQDAFQVRDQDANIILNVDTTNRRVGIGTTGPLTALEVANTLYSSVNGFNFNILSYDTATAGQGVGGGIGFAGNSDGQRVYSAIQGFHESATATDYAGGLKFLTRAEGGSTIDEQLRIGSTGQTLFKNSANSAAAFRIQNAAATATLLNADTSNLRLGVGTTTPLATFDVRGLSGTTPIASISGQTSNAGLIVDNNGVGDLFTASKSGATKFTIANNGNIQFAGTSNFLNTIQTAATAARTYTLPDASGTLCLQGSTSCGFVTGTNYWQSANAGTIAPYNDTVDLLIGGTSTASAKFAFINNTGSGTPTASISGATGSLSMTATGVIGTTNAQTLTLGSASTGNLAFAPGGNTAFTAFANGRIGIGTTNPLATLDLRGNSGTLPAASISAQTSNAGLIVDNSGVGDLFTASSSGLNRFVIKQNGNVGIGTAAPATMLDVNGTIQALAQLNLTSAGVRLVRSGTNLQIRVDNITSEIQLFTSSTQRAVLDTSGNFGIGTATPLSTLDVRGTSGTTPIASLSGQTSNAGLIVDNNGVGDLFTASKSGATKFVITNAGNVGIGSTTGTAKVNIVPNASQNALSITNDTSGVEIQFTGAAAANIYQAATQALYLNSNTGAIQIGAQGSGSTDLYIRGATVGSSFAGSVGIGPNNTTPLAALDVKVNAGTQPVASLSGATSFASLVIDQSGLGDLFAASKSGATKFTILNNGNVRINNLANCDTIDTDANGVLACGTDAGAGNTNYWQFNNGAVSPFVDTADLLVGGTSTASAKFAFLNNTGSGTPTASISAGLTGSTYLTATGVIGTTNAQTLTLGSASTGNLAFAPGGNTAFTAFANGRIGIGTTNPLATLDLRGNSGTLPAASISAQTSNAGLIVDNNGVGDLFTASKSGATKFVITNAGDVGIGTDTPGALLDVKGPSTGRVLAGVVSGVPTFGAIGFQSTLSATNFALGADTNNTVINALTTKGIQFRVANSNKMSLDTNGNLGIGTTGPLATLDVRGVSGTTPVASFSGQTSNAGLIVDNNGVGDLLTASKSGATKFVIKNNGDIQINNLANCPAVVSDANGVLSCGAVGATQNYWQLNGAALSPSNSTFDFLLGATATSAAKFAVTGLAGGTPVASVSATGTGNGLTFSGNGVIQSLQNQTLVLGGNTTGNIALTEQTTIGSQTNGLLITTQGAISDLDGTTVEIDDDLQVTGNDILDSAATARITLGSTTTLTNTTTTFSGTTTITASGLTTFTTAASLTMGSTTSLTLGGNATAYGGTGASSTLTLAGTSSGTPSNAHLFLNPTGQGSVAIGTTNPLATLDVRGNSGTTPVASVAGTTARAALIVDNNGVGDLFTASKSGASKFVIKNSGNVGIGTTNPASELDVNGTISTRGTSNGINIYAVDGNPTPFTLYSATGELTFYSGAVVGALNTSGQLGLGINNNVPQAQLDVLPFDFALPAGLLSGSTGKATLVLNQTSTAGDILTASRSGTKKFTVLNNGDVQIANLTTAGGVLYTNGSGTVAQTPQGTSGQCLQSQGVTGAPQWGACDGAGSINSFTLANGLLYNSNLTTDFAIGGNSSESAKFQVSISGTRPTASISANTSNAGLIVDNNGVGDLFAASKSGATKFAITNSGTVAIGQFPRSATSTTPAGTLHLWGLGTFGSDAILRFGDVGSNANPYIKESGTGDSDQLELGGKNGLIFATGTGATYANERMRIDSLGNVLINTSSALATFDVRGISGTTSVASVSGQTSNAGLIVDNNGVGDLFTASKSGATKFVINNAGNVGIGTTLPTAMLDVAGAASISGALSFRTGAGEIQTTGKNTLTLGGATTGNITINPNLRLAVSPITNSASAFQLQNAAGTSYFNGDATNGRVAIGTVTAPATTLEVAAAKNALADAGAAANYLQLLRNTSGTTNQGAGLGFLVDAGTADIGASIIFKLTGGGDRGDLGFYTKQSGSGGAAPVEVFNINDAGVFNLLGTTLAGTSLTTFNTGANTTIGGTTANGDLTLQGTSNATRASSYVLIQPNGGAVGVGTTTPLATFDVRGNSGTTPVASVAGTTAMASLVVDNNGVGDLFTASKSGATKFFISNAGVTNISLIGTAVTAASGTLCHSGGDVDASTNTVRGIVACSDVSNDYAEWYEVKDAAEAGDIMVTSNETFTYQAARSNPRTGEVYNEKVTTTVAKLQKSQSKYASNQVGIVSTSPHSIIGADVRDQGANPHPIALSGIVPVKVSTESGKIEKGDRITTSSIPGVGMKATKAGQVIGMAFASYDGEGVGQIMVFVNNSWYDPLVSMNDEGNITISGKPLSTESLQSAFADVKNYADSKVAELDASSSAKLDTLSTKLSDIDTNVSSLGAQLSSLQDRVSSLEMQASGSAFLISAPASFTASSAAELDLDKLDVKSATVSETFNVLGRTTLSDVGITGKVNIGLLSIDGLNQDGVAAINTSAGPLKLQSTGFNGVDILDGKLTIDTAGNLQTEGAITAKKINLNIEETKSASAGKSLIKAGTANVVVDTNAVTENSLIYATFDSDYAPATRYWIAEKADGTSFTLKLDKAVTKDARFNWWIVN